MQMTIAPASPLSLPLEAPTTTLATRTITPGIERSMPPFMITSISPRAATARKVMKGSTALLSDADESVSGATIWQTTSRKAVASQTPTKPEPGSALLRSSRSFRFRSLERDPSRGTGAAVTSGCLAHPLGSKLLPRCRQILNTPRARSSRTRSATALPRKPRKAHTLAPEESVPIGHSILRCSWASCQRPSVMSPGD